MKPLTAYDLIKEDIIHLKSPVCNVAESVIQSFGNFELKAEVNGLILSYFNQWGFAIDAYKKLYHCFQELNATDDTPSEPNLPSLYDLKGVELDPEFRRYSYLIVISLKSLLDSFICLVDISQNRQKREGYYPDFFNYGKKWWGNNEIPALETELKKLRKPGRNNLIINLQTIRNKIIHHGYLLKPILEFKKNDLLLMRLYKGNDYYSEGPVDIGGLFESFMQGMAEIERAFEQIFRRNEELLPDGLTHTIQFQYSDSFSHIYIKDNSCL